MSWPTTPSRRCAITIPAAQVGTGGVTDFTVLISQASVPSEIFSVAKSNGADIRAATSSDGSGLLTVDVISFDAGNSKCLLAIGPVGLSAVTANTIWISYGDSGASAQTGSNAYNSDWVGYWPTGGGTDRLGSNNATAYNTTAGGTTGKEGRPSTSFSGSGDYVLLGSDLVTKGPVTISLWANELVPTSRRESLFTISSSTNEPAGLLISGENNTAYIDFRFVNTNTYNAVLSSTSALFTDSGHHHLVITWGGAYNPNDIHLTVDGDRRNGSGSTNPTRDWGGDWTVGGGAVYLSNKLYKGIIGNVQVHSVERASAWVTTEYNNTNAPASFATAGTPESLGSSFNPAWARNSNIYLGSVR